MATQGQPGAPLNSNKISIITKSEIRYEGILYHINPQDQNITLCNVKSFGTEGRRPGDEIAPSPQVHEYIIFRGTDIKDLKVLEAAPQPADPLAGANTQTQTTQQQTAPKEQVKENRQDMKQGGNQEEFDFDAMQSRFQKLTTDFKQPEVKNYRQDDFFDSLSTSTADKAREVPYDRIAQKKTDKETFGSEYVDQAGNRGGRGGYRRGGNRGGRGGYNRGGHGGGRGGHYGGDRNYEGGNRNYEGGNRNYQGGNRNYEGGNRNYEGGNRNYEGGNRNYQGGNRNYEGGNKNYEGGNRNYEGGQTRNYEGGNRNYQGGNRNYEGGNRNYEGGNRNYEGGNRNYQGGNRNYDGGNQGGQRRYGGNQGGNRNYGGGNRQYGNDRNQETFGDNQNQQGGNFYKTYETKQQDQGQKNQDQLF